VKAKYLIGIDEAGRGPIAGPVAVGAVIINLDTWRPSNVEPLGHLVSKFFSDLEIRDSKKLSARQREKVFNRMRELKKKAQLDFAVALVNNQIIDEQGIVSAINLALAQALGKIALMPADCQILLDGSLHAPAAFVNQQTIIRGDESEPIISLASIAAKVTRDNFMVKLDKQYPQYHFDQHKGYGTRLHYSALARHGLSDMHRRSFLTPP